MEEQVIIGTPGKVRQPLSPQPPHCVRSRGTVCTPLHASGHLQGQLRTLSPDLEAES